MCVIIVYFIYNMGIILKVLNESSSFKQLNAKLNAKLALKNIVNGLLLKKSFCYSQHASMESTNVSDSHY